MVTDMVQRGELTKDSVTFFHHLAAEPAFALTYQETNLIMGRLNATTILFQLTFGNRQSEIATRAVSGRRDDR